MALSTLEIEHLAGVLTGLADHSHSELTIRFYTYIVKYVILYIMGYNTVEQYYMNFGAVHVLAGGCEQGEAHMNETSLVCLMI